MKNRTGNRNLEANPISGAIIPFPGFIGLPTANSKVIHRYSPHQPPGGWARSPDSPSSRSFFQLILIQRCDICLDDLQNKLVTEFPSRSELTGTEIKGQTKASRSSQSPRTPLPGQRYRRPHHLTTPPEASGKSTPVSHRPPDRS